MAQENQPLPILITPKAHEKIMQYAQMCNMEISGFAALNLNTQIIDRVFPLMEQECSGSETTRDEKLLLSFIESGQSARANVWWHSHVMMGCFWSGTDNECIEQLGKSMNWLISVVVNKKREYRARVDFFKPIRVTVDAVLRFNYEFPLEEIEKIRTEVKEKVNIRKAIVKDIKGSVREYLNGEKLSQYNREYLRVKEEELNGYGFKTVETDGRTKIVPMTDKEKHEYMQKSLAEQLKEGTKDGNTRTDRDDLPFGGETGFLF